MAWIDRYSFTFKSRREGLLKVTLQKDEASGTLKEFVPESLSHTQTRWSSNTTNGFDPFMLSQSEISFVDRVPLSNGIDFEIADFLVSLDHERHGRVKIETAADALLWIGYIVPNDISQTEDYLSSGSFRAVDGLALLKTIDYTESSDPDVFYSGRDTVANIIMDVLDKVGHGIGFTFDCDWYSGGLALGLTATDNPLDNYYVDREIFRDLEKRLDWGEYLNTEITERITQGWAVQTNNFTDFGQFIKIAPDVRQRFDDSGNLELVQDKPIDCYQVLDHLLRRFNLQVRIEGGKWRIGQPEQYNKASIRIWEYDKDKVFLGTSSYDPRVVTDAEDEKTIRGSGQRSSLDSYTAVEVTYDHGQAQLLKDPTLAVWGNVSDAYAPPKFFDFWERSSGSVTRYDAIDAPGGWPTADYQIRMPIRFTRSANLGTPVSPPTEWFQQIGEITVPKDPATKLFATLEYSFALNNTGARLEPLTSRVWLPVRIILRGALGTDYYLKLLNRGVGIHAWLPLTGPDDDGWQFIQIGFNGSADWESWLLETGELPDDGTVDVRIGQIEVISYGLASPISHAHYDNIRIRPGFGQEDLNSARRITTNYISRDPLRGLKLSSLIIGDGPTEANRSHISYDVDGEELSGNWKIGFYDTGDPDSEDTIDVLQGRVILEQMRKPRRVHEALYSEEPPFITTQKVLYRSGQAYYPMSLSKDWVKSTSEGSWYRINQDSFSDDIETEAIPGSRGGSLVSSSGFASGLFNDLTNAVGQGEGSRQVAVTDAVINSGSQTVLPIATMTEALIDSGDRLFILAPDLSYYNVICAADQLVNDGSLLIEEYDFPVDVGYPAPIYKVEEEIVTAVRMGERGFAVSATAGDDLIINETTSGSVTTLAIRPAEIDVPTGTRLIITHQDGSAESSVVLTQKLHRGEESITFASTDVDVQTQDRIKIEGLSSRGDFLVTKNFIRLAVTGTLPTESAQVGPFAKLSDDVNSSVNTVNVDVFDSNLNTKLYTNSIIRFTGYEILGSVSQSITYNPSAETDVGGSLVLSSGVWSTYGFRPGITKEIKIKGSPTNDGIYRVDTIFGNTITLKYRYDLNSEVGPSSTILGFDPGVFQVVEARLEADVDEGAVSNPVNLDITTLNAAATAVPFKMIAEFSLVQLASLAPQETATSLTIFLEGIVAQANVFRSHNWDGEIDGIGSPFAGITSGVITQPGTEGWCFTGVTGNAADADITGTLHAGGYNATAGVSEVEIGPDGINIVAVSDFGPPGSPVPNAIQWLREDTLAVIFSMIGVIPTSTGNYSAETFNVGFTSAYIEGNIVFSGLQHFDDIEVDWLGVNEAIHVNDELVIRGFGIGAPTRITLQSDDTLSIARGVFSLVLDIIDASGAFYDAEAVIEILGTEIIRLTSASLGILDGHLRLNEIAAPSTPPSGEGYVYMKTGSGGVFFKNDADEEYDLTQGTGGGGASLPHGITIPFPTNIQDDEIFFTNQAITITQLTSIVKGTSPSVTWTVRYAADRSAAGTQVITAGVTTTNTTTGQVDTTFDNASIPANSWVWLETSATSGTVTSFHLSIMYDVD